MVAITDLFEVGDTFVDEAREWTVVQTSAMGLQAHEVKIERLDGTTKVVPARRLIEMVTEHREPVTND